MEARNDKSPPRRLHGCRGGFFAFGWAGLEHFDRSDTQLPRRLGYHTSQPLVHVSNIDGIIAKLGARKDNWEKIS